MIMKLILDNRGSLIDFRNAGVLRLLEISQIQPVHFIDG